MKKLVVLTGAGISAESGLKTFRDSNGLWEGHNVMDVASPEGWQRNPELVLDFYNQRRRQLHEVSPNAGHLALAALETHFEVHIITQNVDNLHERAGSSRVLHLHGELLKVRSTQHEHAVLDWSGDLNLGDTDARGHQLRPHIVWFGEAVPALEQALELTRAADIFAVIGTSLQVYPAAGLIEYTRGHIPIFYIDPHPAQLPYLGNPVTVIAEAATTGVAKMHEQIMLLLG
ncbi:MAG: NAD-dependent deacylase [Bacteroidetes bacterium]|nr:NAD-dependent deacylase [Bacteroidota bacterium]